jgi:hypothetical protein
VAPAALLLLALLGLSLALGTAKSRLSAEIYEGRLRELADEYHLLREKYNQAVMRSAVTELHVENGQLAVRIRTERGVLKTIPVPYDPQREIYVDYVIYDGRLWIRRVFDSATPPEKGTVVDPVWKALDWSDHALRHGKAVYRKLEEGTWTITVSGNGALGLERAGDGQFAGLLVPPPPVRDFTESVEEAREEANGVGTLDVVRYLLRGGE